MPATAREEQRGWGLGFTGPVGWISAGRRYLSRCPVRLGLVAPGAESASLMPPLPRASPKRGALPLVREVGWTGSAPVRSQDRETAEMGSRN